MRRTRSTTHLADPCFQFALAKAAPQLNAEQEQALARRWRELGDRRAAETLSRANLRAVTALATKYRHYGIPISELVAEGNCGLVHALGKFDPDRGVRFATYAAHWVRAYILGYVLRSWSIVSGVSGPMRSQLFFKFRRERARMTTLFGEGEECERALAERLNITVERVRFMIQRLDSADVSVDEPAHRDSRTCLIDHLAATSNPEQSLEDERFRGCIGQAVKEALRHLDPRERYIVEHRLLADSDQEASLAQIGRRFGISRERARQLETRAKLKLKLQVTTRGGPALAEWLAPTG
jgi:RNA polymerase sigma-32 factor